MTDSTYEEAHAIKERQNELYKVIELGTALCFSDNLQKNYVYVNAFIDKDSVLIEDIKQAVAKEIKRLQDSFDKLK